MKHRTSFLILASTSLLAASASGSPFVDWWSNLEARCESGTYPGAIATHFNLAKLVSILNPERLIPKDKIGKVEGIYSLYEKGSRRVLLATPTDRFKRDPNLRAGYYSATHLDAWRACQEDKSWLIIQLGNVWTEIELGEFDGNEIGEGELVLYMYAPDAEKMFRGVEATLRTSDLTKVGKVTVRYGGPGANSREVDLAAR